jgi:hypothetical protein
MAVSRVCFCSPGCFFLLDPSERNCRNPITFDNAASTTTGGVEGRRRGREPEVQTVHSVYSTGMSHHQIVLLEHALRQVFRIDQTGWDEIPLDLHPSFAKYMSTEVWTGLPDLLTLREAALMIIRDAIARTGEFGNEKPVSVASGM